MSKIIYCIQVKNLHSEWANTGEGFSDEKKAADHCKQVLCKGLCGRMGEKDFEALFTRFGVASALVDSFERAEGGSEMCDHLLKMEEEHPRDDPERCDSSYAFKVHQVCSCDSRGTVSPLSMTRSRHNPKENQHEPSIFSR